jgi:membrane AbrB-like protein
MRMLPVAPLRNWAELAAIYAVAAVAGWVALRVEIPLPWMIGPLVATAVIYVSGLGRVVVPVQTRPFGQLIVAAQVGLYFSPAAFAMLITLAPLVVGMAGVTVVCSVIVAIVVGRMTGIPLGPALLGTIPTSPVEAAVLARRFGLDPAPIILSQTLRIAFIDGWPDRSVAVRPTAEFDPIGLGLLVAGALAGAVALRALRISNAYFLGPLAVSAALTASGVEPHHFPPALLAVAQVVLGTWLGSSFRRTLFLTAGRLVGAAFATSLLLLSMTTLAALVVAGLTDMAWEPLVLGAAPGGVTEMALTAEFLDQDVPLVTAFHLTRIFLLMPNIPWMIATLMRFGTKGGG